jgi:hypothetical protein
VRDCERMCTQALGMKIEIIMLKSNTFWRTSMNFCESRLSKKPRAGHEKKVFKIKEGGIENEGDMSCKECGRWNHRSPMRSPLRSPLQLRICFPVACCGCRSALVISRYGERSKDIERRCR